MWLLDMIQISWHKEVRCVRQVEDLMSLDFDALTQKEDFLEELVPFNSPKTEMIRLKTKDVVRGT